MTKSTLLIAVARMLRGLGSRMIDRIWRLGAGARLFFLTIFYSGESFRRFHLILREIYFTGVMSLLIIIVSAFFVGMVLAAHQTPQIRQSWCRQRRTPNS